MLKEDLASLQTWPDSSNIESVGVQEKVAYQNQCHHGEGNSRSRKPHSSASKISEYKYLSRSENDSDNKINKVN